VLALLSFMALVISVLATAASWALMMFGNDSATAVIVLGLALAAVFLPAARVGALAGGAAPVRREDSTVTNRRMRCREA
jgi:hypothetical protein